MPINAGPEYFIAEKRYLQAKTKDEKIKYLEEMMRALPKHKGTEHLLSQLRKRMKKLKSESTKKSTAKPKFSIKKEGAAQVCIIGLTGSGKSSLLRVLTNAKVEVRDYPYTTKNPVVGMMMYGDVQLQVIEIPATFDSDSSSLLHTCDEILILLDATKNLEDQREELKKFLNRNRLENKRLIWAVNKIDAGTRLQNLINISVKSGKNLEMLKEKMWKELSMIRVYTKSPGKPKDLPALALPKDSTVRDAAKSIHKDFLKDFKFARVFNYTKFSGQKVGLDFKLKDLDVIEIHTD